MAANTLAIWKGLELLGVWAAAVATFYAARTALKIANRQFEERLIVRHELNSDSKTDWDTAIHVQNVGNSAVEVNLIRASFGLFNRRNSPLEIFVKDGNGPLPDTIPPKHQKSYLPAFSGEVRFSALSMFPKPFPLTCRRVDWILFLTYRLEVLTSGGSIFRARPALGTWEWLRSERAEYLVNQETFHEQSH
jgi:hypothetical protein